MAPTLRVTKLILIAASSCIVRAWVTPSNQRVNRKTTPRKMKLSMAVSIKSSGGQSKRIQQKMIDFIEIEPKETVDSSRVKGKLPSDDDLAPVVRTMAMAADMRKADNIVAMRISKISTIASFMIICSGNSRPQNQAIAAAIKDEVKENFGDQFVMLGNGAPEGSADSGWILLDYGDIMVHVMTPKSRLFYDIEGQWREKGGEYMDLEDVLLPDNASTELENEVPQVGGGMLDIAEQDDPFWS